MDKRYNSLFTCLLLVFTFFAFTLWMGSAPGEAKVIEGMQVDISPPAVLDRTIPQIQAAIAIQEHYSQALLALPEVVGTATGLTEQGNPAVIVFTKEPETMGIPARLEGIPIVVSMTGEIYALKPDKQRSKGRKTRNSTTAVLTPPVPIGVSTGNEDECSAGTIGARVTDGTNYYALSNNHVYARENNAFIGSKVLQPGLYDTRCVASGNVIGELAYFVPINFGRGINTVDAALADIYWDMRGQLMVDNTTPSNGYGTPKSATAEPAIGATVEKYGRTTRLTVGTITGINATIRVNYGESGYATFSNQIIVQSRKRFVKAGDSGSLIVTSSGLNPVGLLFAGNSTGRYCVANDINAVLDRLSELTKTTLTIDGK